MPRPIDCSGWPSTRSNPEAATAAGLLSDVRRVSVIAKSTAADAVREIALARLTDERALGGVARHAKVESTALAAAARLGSADELLATVLNSEHGTSRWPRSIAS